MAAEFAQKQVFKAKAKTLGKSLGVDTSADGGGTFGKMFGKGESNTESDVFADDGPSAPFASAPPNYPPLLCMVYIDRDILSDAARPALGKINVIFIMSFFVSIANIAVSLYRLIAGIDQGWVEVLASVLAAPIVWGLQLFGYETAFRGAYRTSRPLMLKYLVFALGNVCILALYALANFGHFHGWLHLASIDFRKRIIMRYIVCFESMAWTIVLCLQIHAALSFREFRSSHVTGLSSTAKPPTQRGLDEEAPPDPKKQAIEDIRARYAKN